MAAMLTYDGNCCIAVNYDPEAITRPAEFGTCLRAGVDVGIAPGLKGVGNELQ
jgi:hypothetical protein